MDKALGSLGLFLGVVLALGGAVACGDDGDESDGVDAATCRGRCGADAAVDGGEDLGYTALRDEALELPEDHEYATDFAFLPGRDELLLTEKNGRVTHYRLHDDGLEQLGQMQIETYDDLDCGLISVAVDPAFEDNGFVYFGSCTSQYESGIFRYHLDLDDYEGSAETGAPIFLAEEPRAERPWHNVGALVFDDEGYLWSGIGDKTLKPNANDPDTPLGSVIRIEPSRDPDGEGHEPAPGNPFENGGGDPAIYAMGVRSPWRIALGSQGRIWVGDVGLDTFEEVNVVVRPGQHFGWPMAEGPCREDCGGLDDPVVFWPRDEHQYIEDDPDANPSTKRVAWVGAEYQPDSNGDRYGNLLTGGVLFGDACLSYVRIAGVSDEGELERDEPLGHLPSGTVAVRQGGDGYLYGLAMGACVSDGDEPPIARFFRLMPE